MGHYAWSVREKETYALVFYLLNFKSWISGRQVTVFTDHKSLESWYKEEFSTMAGSLGHRGRWHEFLSGYNIVVVYKPGVENDAADGMSRWAYPARLVDDTNFHRSDADLEGVTQWEASEGEKEQKLSAANGRPLPQDMQEQRERDYFLLQVMRLHDSVHYDSNSLPDESAVDVVQSVSDHCEHCCPFPSCLSTVSMSLDEDSSSEAKSSVGPDEAIWNVLDETEDVSPLCYSEGDPAWVAGSPSCNLTEVKVPPETKILYEDWMPHYRADRTSKRLLDRGLENQVSMDGYLWAKGPQWSHRHIRRHGKICVPQSIVSEVIRAVHVCAHLGQAKALELFLQRFHADMPYARLREAVNKTLSDCVVCAQAKARRGQYPDSCKRFPIPSFPLSSVAIDFVDLAEVRNQSTKTKIFANYAMVIVCRLTGYVMAIPCCKEGLASCKAAELFLPRCGFFVGLPREIEAGNQSIISSTFFDAPCNLAGIEQAKSIIYRPKSNGRAERAVQSTILTLRQYLLSKKVSWLEALPLALWGLNDLPEAVSPY